MSLYKYNITVKVDDEDDKYNEMTIRLGIKNVIYVILTPVGFKYFNEKIPIERLV